MKIERNRTQRDSRRLQNPRARKPNKRNQQKNQKENECQKDFRFLFFYMVNNTPAESKSASSTSEPSSSEWGATNDCALQSTALCIATPPHYFQRKQMTEQAHKALRSDCAPLPPRDLLESKSKNPKNNDRRCRRRRIPGNNRNKRSMQQNATHRGYKEGGTHSLAHEATIIYSTADDWRSKGNRKKFKKKGKTLATEQRSKKENAFSNLSSYRRFYQRVQTTSCWFWSRTLNPVFKLEHFSRVRWLFVFKKKF